MKQIKQNLAFRRKKIILEYWKFGRTYFDSGDRENCGKFSKLLKESGDLDHVDLSLENSADSYLWFPLALLKSVSYFFFLYWSPSSPYCMVFDSISPNIDEALSINLSAHVFVFGNFNIHHIRTGSPILVELINPINSVIFFLSQMTLCRWLTFLLRFQTVILTVPLLWMY